MEPIYNTIFQSLYKSQKGLMPFTLYRRHGIEPEHIVRFVQKCRMHNFIISGDDYRLTLTRQGRDFVSAFNEFTSLNLMEVEGYGDTSPSK
jgi:hypothetical protein